MRSEQLELRTGATLVTDLTGTIAGWLQPADTGLLNVFVPHATAGVALIETGSGTESDLHDTLERMLPTADIYRHRHGSLGHGRDHVMPAIVSPSVTIPVDRGLMLLGTWQSVCLVDPNGDNPHRRVRLTLLTG